MLPYASNRPHEEPKERYVKFCPVWTQHALHQKHGSAFLLALSALRLAHTSPGPLGYIIAGGKVQR